MKRFVSEHERLRIRAEAPSDHEAISTIVEAAFGRRMEARLVELLRESDCYLPDLTLVAEQGGEIVGHVMISYATLRRADDEVRVLSLAPFAVAPKRQNDGIGSALMRESISRADETKEPLVMLIGHPNYYPRFGFERARPLGIEPPPPGAPDAVFMVRKLSNYDESYQGQLIYPQAFEDAERE